MTFPLSSRARVLSGLAILVLAIGSTVASLQAAAPVEREARRSGGPFRNLAPGVERHIDPERKVSETFSHHDIVELLRVDPSFGWAKNVIFRHRVADLQFIYKPVRFVTLDLPAADGTLQPTKVWYLVYRVVNRQADPFRFVPRFQLETVDRGVFYGDVLLPQAVAAIRQREDPARHLRSTVEMTGPIPSSPEGQEISVWGVACWTGVDPRTDRFSIFVGGLSNAYQWVDLPEGDRELTYKTLQLDFWRPSDEFHAHEGEIRRGFPEQDVDYHWVYR